MKALPVKDLRKELNMRSSKELIDICLKLSRFKKENKELLTYLLVEADDEEAFIRSVKQQIDEQFAQINTRSFYLIKKSVRKILREIRKYIRYSKKKPTEVELLLHFVTHLKNMKPSIRSNYTLNNLYERQLASIRKAITYLHEDLQYDYTRELEDLML